MHNPATGAVAIHIIGTPPRGAPPLSWQTPAA